MQRWWRELAKRDYSKVFEGLNDDNDPLDDSEFMARFPKASKPSNKDIFAGEVKCHAVDKLIPFDKLKPAPKAWNFYPTPDEETMEKLKTSLVEMGQQKVAVVRLEDDGTYMIAGGHSRFKALKELHEQYPDRKDFTGMRCNVYTKDVINDAAFKILIVEDNETQRAKEDERFIAAGIKVHRDNIANSSFKNYGSKSRKAMMEKYGVSSGKIGYLDQISRLVNPLFELYLLGEITQKDGVVISKLPNELQEYFYSLGITKLSKEAREKLPLCKSEKDINAVLTADKKKVYTFGGMEVSRKMPSSLCSISLPLPKDPDKLENVLLTVSEKIENELGDDEETSFVKEVVNLILQSH